MKIVEGDAVQAVLNGDVDYLIHVANCKGVMGSYGDRNHECSWVCGGQGGIERNIN